MKQCFKCGQEKSLDAFYKHSGMKDGHLNKCKECTKSDVKANYAKNFAYYQRYEQERSQTTKRKVLSIKIHQRWKKQYPERRKAHEAVNNAIRDCRLVPQVCCVCGNKGEAHHPDYSRPLDVVWLCSKHHKEVHQMVESV